ncbi:unnamed protein product, partial [Musa banksii]
GNGPRERPAGPALAGEAAVGGPRPRIRRLIHRCLRPTRAHRHLPWRFPRRFRPPRPCPLRRRFPPARAHRRPPRLPDCVPFRYRLLPGRGGRQHAVRGSPPQQPTQQGDELLPRAALSAAGGDAALPRAPAQRVPDSGSVAGEPPQDGTYLVEVDRLLRPEGYLVISGPPVQWTNQDKEWADLQAMVHALCYKLITVDGNTAIWKKPSGASCLPNLNNFRLDRCSDNDDQMKHGILN